MYLIEFTGTQYHSFFNKVKVYDVSLNMHLGIHWARILNQHLFVTVFDQLNRDIAEKHFDINLEIINILWLEIKVDDFTLF